MLNLNTEIKSGLQSYKLDTSSIPCMQMIGKRLNAVLEDSDGAVREICKYVMDSGGKRIRPLLVLYSGLLFHAHEEELIYAAIAAELIHMASLVHDDIIDESSLRHNKPSINQKWGNQVAVLGGDYLFAKAFGVLSGNRLIKSMDYMVDAIENMCSGEIVQAKNQFNDNTDMNQYYERIEKKTAIFLKNCCMSGASIGKAGDKNLQLIGEYGLNLGFAFQIIDDILDFMGNVNVMGKPKGEDLNQGNITLPIILLLKDRMYGDWCREVIRNRELNEAVINRITEALKESDAINQSFVIAASHIERAKYCLSQLPESEHKNLLYELTEMLKKRMN